MTTDFHSPSGQACGAVKPEAARASSAADHMVADAPIQIDREKIAEFCRARGIRKLSLFGSAVRDDFDPLRSDVDVLVELAADTQVGLAYFGWADELSRIFGRKTDLSSRLNKHIEDEVRREALTLYEQA